jgi:hypothetical protein
MSKYLILLLLITGFSCSSSPYKLSKKALKIEMLKRKPSRNSDCVVVAKVMGSHPEGSSELAENMARNTAADEGADSLFIEDTIANGKERKVEGTAYKCN